MSNLERILSPIFLSICLIAPLSVDIFISGMPAIQAQFPNSDASLVLSITLLGLALSQPIYGPLLDRFGRKPVLLCGFYLFTFASFLIMIADSYSLLIFGRFLQAVGGCSGVVTSFAIARDRYEQHDLVKAIGLIMAIIGISPIVAPLIGSFLHHFWNWRASFVFLFMLGLFYTLLIQFFFKETFTNKSSSNLSFNSFINNYLQLAKTDQLLRFCLSSGCSYSVLFAYLSLSSLFIIEQMHYSVISYGWIIAVNAIAIVMMAKLAPVIALRISLSKTIVLGFTIMMLGGVVMLIMNLTFNIRNIYSFMFPMFLTTIGAGIIRPTISSSVMQLAPKNMAGTASSFFHFISFFCGFLTSMIATKTVSSVEEFGFFICICALVAMLFISKQITQILPSLLSLTPKN